MDNNIDEKFDTLEFNIARLIRYHEKRSDFYDWLDKATNLIALMFSSSALAGLWGDNQLWVALSAIGGSFTSALPLVFNFSTKSRDHSDFKNEYYQIYNKLKINTHTEQLLEQLTSERFLIEAKSPTMMIWVDAIAYNEQVRAMGYPSSELLQISKWQYFTSHFHNFGVEKICQMPTNSCN